jgi:hypothetical protein
MSLLRTIIGGMRLEKARVAEKQHRLEEAWAVIAGLSRAIFSKKLRKVEGEKGSTSYSSKEMFGSDIPGRNVTTS